MVQQTGASAVAAGRRRCKMIWWLRTRSLSSLAGRGPVPDAKRDSSKAASYRPSWRSRVKVVIPACYGLKRVRPFDALAKSWSSDILSLQPITRHFPFFPRSPRRQSAHESLLCADRKARPKHTPSFLRRSWIPDFTSRTMPGRLHKGNDTCSSLSRAVRFCGWSLERPLQGQNPAAELVLRDHEDLEIRRAPLQELAAQLLEPLRQMIFSSLMSRGGSFRRSSFWRETSVKELRPPATSDDDKPGGRCGGMLVLRTARATVKRISHPPTFAQPARILDAW